MDAILELARKRARERARQSDEYFERQNARNMARAINPSVADLEEIRDIKMIDGIAITPQSPVVATSTPISHDASMLTRNIACQDPATPGMPVPDRLTGSPVSLSIVELKALKGEDQKRAIARILAVDGAKTRIREAGASSLMASLEMELDYQRKLVAVSKTAERDGRTRPVSKIAAKKDLRKGHRPMKDGGTSRMTKNTPVRLTTCQPGPYLHACKLRRGDPDQLAINAAKDRIDRGEQ